MRFASQYVFCSFFSAARRTNGESAAAVIGLFARTPTPRSGAAELAPLKQSSPFSLLGCRPLCPINAVCFAICFLLLIKGRLLQCSEACFCPFFFAARRTNQEAPSSFPDKCGFASQYVFCSFFSTARRTNGESAAAVIGLFARSPTRRLFCFAAKYLLFVIFAPIYSAYCKKMAYNFCFL